MVKIRNIFEIYLTLGFTEFDFFKISQDFDESKLDKVHSVFPFERIAKEAGLSE